MTAVAPAVVPWRRLAWVTWRQHRVAVAVFAALAVILATAMAVTGVALHSSGRSVFSVGPGSPWRVYDATRTALLPALLLLPVLAGLFLGAPLVAREYETGSARFAWCQGAGRVRFLVAAVLPFAPLLAVIATGLGLEYRWWLSPLLAASRAWQADTFSLSPLAFTGWMVLGFSLGVFFGSAIRRTVPAMAATFGCYLVLLYQVSASWRLHYLAPLRVAGTQPTFSAGGGYGWGFMYSQGRGPDVLSSALGWPDGRLLSNAQLNHPAAWFRLHHIQVWVTYQPGSRYQLFQLIEFGWLTALSAVLIAATLVMVRRRAA
jgi:hypothetical protein